MRNRHLVALVVVLVTVTMYSGVTENAPSANAVQQAAAKLTWQTVWGDHTQRLVRAKVPGGWLLRLSGLSSGGGVSGGGITFYPDPSHSWNGSSLP